MTEFKGRGVFATKNIKEGTILIIEKPIVHVVNQYNFSDSSL